MTAVDPQLLRLRDSISGLPRLSQDGIAEVWVDDLTTADALATNPEA